jgi:virginiamycin B lyase
MATAPTFWPYHEDYPDPGGFGAPHFSESASGQWPGYKTSQSHFPIRTGAVTLNLEDGIKFSGTTFHGKAKDSVDGGPEQSSYFVIALLGSRMVGPVFPGIGFIDHTHPHLAEIGNTLRITVSGIRVAPGSDDVLQIMWMPVSDEYLIQYGANGQNAIFLSSAVGEKATFDFTIPAIDPHTGQPISTVAPNLSFQVVNYSTHELEFDIKIENISKWSDQPDAPPQTIKEFATPTPNGRPMGITTGPDGALWFTMARKIGRISVTGTITEFPIPSNLSIGITAGPDGALWFAAASAIGRIRIDGTFTLFPLPTQTQVMQITVGPDGALWFAEYHGSKIGRITIDGVISEYPCGLGPKGIVAGPDGALWFTISNGNKIGRISLDGEITEFSLPNEFSFPDCITTGPDGALWFTEANQANYRGRIGRITTAGVITEFQITVAAVLHPTVIAIALDGTIWFTDTSNTLNVVQMTPDGSMLGFAILGTSASFGLTIGPDGAVWFTDSHRSKICRLRTR